MISIERELGEEISKAVGQIVAASHTAAIKALDQAFDRGRGAGRTSRPSLRPKTSGAVAVPRLLDLWQGAPAALTLGREEVDELIDLARREQAAVIALVAALPATLALAFLAPVLLSLQVGARFRSVSWRITRGRLVRVAGVLSQLLRQERNLLKQLGDLLGE